MKFLITLTCVLLLTLTTNAKIRRVGFTDVPPVIGVDYTNFYLAYGEAANGDTVYVFPGKTLVDGWPNGNINIKKKLILISKGNWLDSSSSPKGNFGLQVSKGTAFFSANVTFYPESEGSVISGFDGQGYRVYIWASNITIKRNFNLLVFLDNFNISNLLVEGNYRVWFTGNPNVNNIYSNIQIKNNFIYQFQLPLKSYTGTIENNIWAFDRTLTQAQNGGDIVMAYYSEFNSSTWVQSNINLQSGSWIFQNNLMVSYFNSNVANNRNIFVINGAENSTLNYNAALASYNFTAWPGTATGNIFIPLSQVNQIFAGFPAIGTKSADNRYLLAAGSPANNANRPGSVTDAGMFGGTKPYKLSTIPSIPTIYKISSPQGNNPIGNTIEIDFGTRSNN
ncbi:MAG: hypothetical protein ABIN97_03995 [Ginsengibacter sp.]